MKKVYRYVTEEELKLMKENPEKLGNTFPNGCLSNSFYYAPEQKYLHFFSNKKDIRLVKAMYKKEGKTFYTCCFNVPFSKLIFHSGRGLYLEAHGFDYAVAKEYAIKAKDFSPSWLCEVEKDER